MPTDPRLNLRELSVQFADPAAVNFRQRVSDISRRLLHLLDLAGPPDITAPSAPTDLTADGRPGTILLRWIASSSSDVSHYQVQRSTVGGGSGFSNLLTTTSLGLLDTTPTPGTPYFYRVAAVDFAGNVSAWSDEATAVATTPGDPPPAPPAPGDWRFIDYPDPNGAPVITLGWTPSSEYDTIQILRSTTSGSGFAVITQDLLPSGLYYDFNVVYGTTYYYVARWVSPGGTLGSLTPEITRAPVPPNYGTPPVPANVSGEVRYTTAGVRARIEWDFIANPLVRSYLIEWGEAEGGPYTEDYTHDNSALCIPACRPIGAGWPEAVELEGTFDDDTTYYFIVKSVMFDGVESADSAEVSIAFPSVSSEPDPAATVPAAPTGVAIVSETATSIRLSWSASNSTNLSGYRVYGGPIDTKPILRASAGLGAGGVNVTGLLPETGYTFTVRAFNNIGVESVDSDTVTGFTSATSGGGGGVYEPPMGGGTGTAGTVSGDTGLGPNHKAPGATFDVVLDMFSANPEAGGGLFVQIGSILRSMVSEGTNLADKRVAILLPEVWYCFGTNLPGTYVRSPRPNGIKLWGPQWNAEEVNLPQTSLTQYHFIAPWPTADIADTLADAKAEDKKFRMSMIWPDGEGRSPGSAGQGGGMINITHGNTNGCVQPRIGFWFCQFDAGSWCTIAGEGHIDPARGGAKTTFVGCDFISPNPFSNRNLEGFTATPQENAYGRNAFLPRFCISTYRIGHDYIAYCNFDQPYIYEHLIYERNPPPGDSYFLNTTVRRVGGQVIQHTQRDPRAGNNYEGPSMGGQQRVGTRFVRDSEFLQWGRSFWSAGAFTLYAAHVLYDFEDCDFVNTNPGRSASWPPTNLASLQGDEFCTGPFSSNNAGTPDDFNAGLCVIAGGRQDWAMINEDGQVNVGVKMRNTRVFIARPGTGNAESMIRCDNARILDIQDSVLLHTGANGAISFNQFGHDGWETSPYSVREVILAGNNIAGDVTAFQTAYDGSGVFTPEVPGGAAVNGTLRWHEPPPVIGQRASTGPSVNTFGGATIQSTFNIPQSGIPGLS